ncbi:MAG: hypothetical protein ABI647_19420 [Gemmatimonadota bacterium]
MNPNDIAPVFIVTLLTFTVGAILIFRGPIGKAIARRLEGSTGSNAELERHRLTELEGRLADLEASQARMAELEERVDFTERLLAQERDPAKELRR